MKHWAGLVAGGIWVFNAYFKHSIGMKGENHAMMMLLAKTVKKWGRPYIVAADFNATWEEIASAALPPFFDAQFVFPEAATCYPKQGQSRTIDGYIVHNSLMEHVLGCGISFESLTKPHRPVWLALAKHTKLPPIRTLRAPRAFPVDRPFWSDQGL